MIPSLAALLAPVIAVAVATIAFLQWRTAHQRVLLDLFDRRMVVYDETMALVREYQRHVGGLELHVVNQFHHTRNRARFLFGDDVAEALKIWHEALIDMAVSQDMIDNRGGSRAEHQPIIAAGMRIATPYRERFPQIFAPYLRMDQKRVRTPLEWLRDKNTQRLSYGDDR